MRVSLSFACESCGSGGGERGDDGRPWQSHHEGIHHKCLPHFCEWVRERDEERPEKVGEKYHHI